MPWGLISDARYLSSSSPYVVSRSSHTLLSTPSGAQTGVSITSRMACSSDGSSSVVTSALKRSVHTVHRVELGLAVWTASTSTVPKSSASSLHRCSDVHVAVGSSSLEISATILSPSCSINWSHSACSAAGRILHRAVRSFSIAPASFVTNFCTSPRTALHAVQSSPFSALISSGAATADPTSSNVVAMELNIIVVRYNSL
mmetsp:Transcript_50/g.148  ORF Transcript_50/g.148 Transcript_50/m.148 type:complete len:201 (-) Transcript_50:6-608(-)